MCNKIKYLNLEYNLFEIFRNKILFLNMISFNICFFISINLLLRIFFFFIFKGKKLWVVEM